MHTIYLDVLFCVNFIIDYMILATVKRFLYLSCRLRRLLLGAAVGGLCSFSILLPPLPSGLSMILNLAFAGFVVGSTFAPIEKKLFLKASGMFFLISFCYCGIMIALWMVFSPDILLIRNSSVYIDISPVMLITASIVCYTVMQVILRITGKGKSGYMVCKVKVEHNGKQTVFSGWTDTGNSLKEPFSGIPVIVAKSSLFTEKKTDITKSGLSDGMRLVPFNSVGGEGLLLSFRSDRVTISANGIKRCVCAYIALCDDEKLRGGEDAIIPYELIS